MTGTEVLEALALGSIAGAASSAAVLFGTIAGRAFAARYRWVGFWPERRQRPPTPDAGPFPAGKLRMNAIPMKCPECGAAFGADIEIEGPFPESNDPAALEAAGMPLGERLVAEKRELLARLERPFPDTLDAARFRARIETRIAAIDRELRRFN
jgi:hypothetical protein